MVWRAQGRPSAKRGSVARLTRWTQLDATLSLFLSFFRSPLEFSFLYLMDVYLQRWPPRATARRKYRRKSCMSLFRCTFFILFWYWKLLRYSMFSLCFLLDQFINFEWMSVVWLAWQEDYIAWKMTFSLNFVNILWKLLNNQVLLLLFMQSYFFRIKTLCIQRVSKGFEFGRDSPADASSYHEVVVVLSVERLVNHEPMLVTTFNLPSIKV